MSKDSWPIRAIFLMLSVLVCRCTLDQENGLIPLRDRIDGHVYRLQVDRIADSPSVPMPASEIPEDQYRQNLTGLHFIIQFDSWTRRVLILPDSAYGSCAVCNSQTLTYHLDEGLFAGGRLIVRQLEKYLEAEYTQYGSGVPVIVSYRGILLAER